MSEQTREPFAHWCVVELLGHRRLGAYVSEQEIAGAGFLRLDVPGPDEAAGFIATQFVQPSSVYCLTPTTEAMARAVAKHNQPVPVQRYELLPPAPRMPRHPEREDFPYADDDDEEIGL